MQQNKSWLKFIITGNPNDYLTYKEFAQIEQINGGGEFANYDRWFGDKGNEHSR